MADFSNQTKLFYLSAIDNLRDPVRNTRWRMLIPDTIFAATGISVTNGDQFANGQEGTDEFALHVKNAKIPDITMTDATHNYMGFKSHHPVNAEIDGTQNFETIMLEDMRAYEAILAWEQSCLNTGLLVQEDGVSDRMNQTGLRLGLGNHKDGENPTSTVLRNQTIKIELYNWMTGDVILQVYLYNAWPKQVNQNQNLTYAPNAEIMNFTFQLQYDRWGLHIPKDYATGL